MAAGVLSGKYLGGARPKGARMTENPGNTRYIEPPNAEPATQAYVDLAKSRGLDPALMALAWVNMQHFLTSNIIGASSMEQLKHDLTSADLTLDEETLTALEDIHWRYTYPCP
jgi:aryl-alcohol dehydrogenase-like predicted oxidoreductase